VVQQHLQRKRPKPLRLVQERKFENRAAVVAAEKVAGLLSLAKTITAADATIEAVAAGESAPIKILKIATVVTTEIATETVIEEIVGIGAVTRTPECKMMYPTTKFTSKN
jgi:hypothetical protein